ncbi:hypothetical protein BH11PSE8_BH11PSE8_38780 [soil metagenome]
MAATSSVIIAHLFDHAEHRPYVAQLIHDEFWRDVPGANAEKMQARLALASRADAIPLCLIALAGGRAVGAINLVEDDDQGGGVPRDWQPWLAAMVVAPGSRGRGIGSQLVRALLAEARALNITNVYLGTEGPGFYTRLGAVAAGQPREGFWFMRFDSACAGGAA